jgi:hypothetical protein
MKRQFLARKNGQGASRLGRGRTIEKESGD